MLEMAATSPQSPEAVRTTRTEGGKTRLGKITLDFTSANRLSVDVSPIEVNPDTPAWLVYTRMVRLNLTMVIVTREGKYAGIITRGRIIRASQASH